VGTSQGKPQVDCVQTLTQLQTKVDQLLAELTPEVIASVTGYPFILDAYLP
jgi:hypothetical protein